MKKGLLFLLSCFCLNTIMAESTDRLVLKDNTTIPGRITNQIPGKQIIIDTEDGGIKIIDFSKISRIERTPRDTELLTGIVDIIETRSGNEYQGQITGQKPGESIELLTEKGLELIATKDIKLQKKEKLNPDYSLVSQAEYLDVVVTASKEYTGIITLQDYGDDNNPSYVLITEADDTYQRVLVSDITELRRITNKDYNPIMQFHVQPGNYYFNQTAVKGVKPLKWKKDWNAIDDNDIKEAQVVIVTDGKLTVQTDDKATNRKCVLLEVQPAAAGKITKYAYSLAEAERGGVPYETTCQDGIEAKWTYTVKEGYYVLQVPESDLVYVVSIVK